MPKEIDLSQSVVSWPVGIKIARLAWGVVWPWVKFLPKQLSILRILTLRLFGAKIGKRCLILPGVKVLMPWNLVMEDFVALGEKVDIYNFAQVEIQRMTVVSQDCYLCTGTHDYQSSNMPLIFSKITIGSQVWIAAKSTLLPGVSVADGCVVGLGSIVTKSLDKQWSVYAGTPVRFISQRVLRN